MNQEETGQLFAEYERFMPKHQMVLAPDGRLGFIVEDDELIIDGEGIVWSTTEISVGPHSFIEIVTGEEKTKRMLLLLCLLNPRSRRAASLLLESTIDPSDGRFNSKSAEFYLTSSKEGCLMTCKLPHLARWYTLTKLFPMDMMTERFQTEHCPFCRELVT